MVPRDRTLFSKKTAVGTDHNQLLPHICVPYAKYLHFCATAQQEVKVKWKWKGGSKTPFAPPYLGWLAGHQSACSKLGYLAASVSSSFPTILSLHMAVNNPPNIFRAYILSVIMVSELNERKYRGTAFVYESRQVYIT